MQLTLVAASVGIICAAVGCATQDQLRQTEIQSAEESRAVQALRAGADRSETEIAGLRGEIRRTQDSIRGLEVALTEARTRTDAARLRADNALSISKEFLANLVAAREEQRRQLAENGAAFADLRRRLTELEPRLQAQQRLLQQSSVALNDASRRFGALEAALGEAGRRSAALEARAKTGQESADGLTRQLATLRGQLEDTRSLISSEGLLQLMRELESVQRDAASLRGSVEELQHAQTDVATRFRNYYLDLDARIQLLKQKIHQQDQADSTGNAPAAEEAVSKSTIVPAQPLKPTPPAGPVQTSAATVPAGAGAAATAPDALPLVAPVPTTEVSAQSANQ
jgi:chromosome segregation ATPase